MNAFNFSSVFSLALLTFVCFIEAKIPSTRLCGDAKCEKIISLAKTTVNYNAGDKHMVSFVGNIPCRIMSKVENSDLWEIEVQGRRGYAPKRMLMEHKILIKTNDLIKVTSEPSMNQDEGKAKDDLAPIFNDNRDGSHSTETGDEHTKINTGETNLNDSLEADNLTLTPVLEPHALKRDIYKTGFSEEDQEKKLGILGLNTPADNDHVKSGDWDTINTIGENNNDRSEKIGKSNEDTDGNAISTPAFEKEAEDNEYLEPHLNPNSGNQDNVDQNQAEPTLEPHMDQNTVNQDNVHSNVNMVVDQNQAEPTLELYLDQNSDIQENSHSNENTVVENNQADPTLELHFDQNSGIQENHSNENMMVDNDQVEPTVEIVANVFKDMKTTSNHDDLLVLNELENVINEPKHSDVMKPLNQEDHQIESDSSDVTEPVSNVLPNNRDEIEAVFLDQPLETVPDSKQSEHYLNLEQKLPEERESQKIVTDDIFSSQNELKPSENIFSSQDEPKSSEDIFYSHNERKPTEEPSEDNGSDWIENIFGILQDVINPILAKFGSTENIDILDNQCSHNSHDSLADDVDSSCPRNTDSISFKNMLEQQHGTGNFDQLLLKLISISDIIILLVLTAFAILIFIFGHYCFVNKRTESKLINKLNKLEKSLLLCEKEYAATKDDLISTRKKLTSIADKSFGADDMIKQSGKEKLELREQITALEKELEAATEAGLELNKMVSDLLNNAGGSDSIINSVEELQRQLNEQETATTYINNLLAEKSRENSELQILIAETNQKFGAKIDEILKTNHQLKTDKENMEQQLRDRSQLNEKKMLRDIEMKESVIEEQKKQYNDLQIKYDEIFSKWKWSSSRENSFEEILQKLKESSERLDIKEIIDLSDVNAKYLASKTENEFLKENLNSEIGIKNHLQEELNQIRDEMAQVRLEDNQKEKDKLEAQKRLEVLSSYFKEKESQLQKELGEKEALFLKQQGESTSTVDRVRSIQEEVQRLRSQNDELRAEIEAQSAAHKAQIIAAEGRAHDSWLMAKQAERRLEETRSEASTLRKKLTSLTFNADRNNIDGVMFDAHSPSPIHIESTNSALSHLPPPPLIPPPLFSTGISQMMPPPPLPLHEMQIRPAPLGRLTSPIPHNQRFVDVYGDKDGYHSKRRYSRDEFTDLYDTETDFSPPRSPGRFQCGDNLKIFTSHPTQNKSSNASKGSNSSSSSDKSCVVVSDEWDRRTF